MFGLEKFLRVSMNLEIQTECQRWIREKHQKASYTALYPTDSATNTKPVLEEHSKCPFRNLKKWCALKHKTAAHWQN